MKSAKRNGGGFFITCLEMAAVLLLAVAGPAAAEVLPNWIGGAEGYYHESANWSTGTAPDEYERPPPPIVWVSFHENVTSLVHFTNNAVAHSLRLYNGPDVTLNLGGYTYELEADESGRHGLHLSRLAFANRTMSLTITNGTLLTKSFVTDGVQNSTVTLTLAGPGMVWTNSGTTMYDVARQDGNDCTLSIRDGAKAYLTGIRVTQQNAGSNTLGRLEIKGTNTLLHNSASAYIGSDRDESYATRADVVVEDNAEWLLDAALYVRRTGFVTVSNATLNANGVSFDPGGTLAVTLHEGGTSPQVHSSANATLDNAIFQFSLAEGFSSFIGEEFTIIRVDGTRTGEFQDLPDGSVIEIKEDRWLGPFRFQVNYAGGSSGNPSGNDFTLKTIAVPPSGTIFRFY